ncbi:enhancer of split malpha protein-like [Anthonomus grandis grandis]|uniref:enhancer of split malpha protein-like n=1 Tax=Anthonomus grandis grandis TaxID=2921223 RepID=UPI002165DE62|nr:enhancer of split malpha protein-like [Anthonomus grandis grandis]
MNFNNDYIVSSNNSINDNKVNAKKVARTPMYQIKKLLKCVLKKHEKSTYKKNPQPNYFMDEEIEDNFANEILENQIFEEIDTCEESAAVSVYNGSSKEVLPVVRGQRYIPVHFARTEAGTFFWTSVTAPDSDVIKYGDENAICNYQTPELQVPADRWAQA